MAKKKEKLPNGADWAREFGIDVRSVDETVEIIIQAVLWGRPLILVGDTGQGKSDAIYQAYSRLKQMAAEGRLDYKLGLNISNPILKTAYGEAREEREKKELTSADTDYEFHCWVPATADAFDYRGLPTIAEDNRTQFYTRPEEIPSNPHGMGIINVREMNRPAAARTVKPLIEMMESRMLGPHIIPEGYRIIGDLNVGDIYEVQDILNPFFIRRVNWVYVQNTPEDFIHYMKKKYPGSIVASFIEEYTDAFDNHAGRVNCQVYACAAIWEQVQQMLDCLFPRYRVHELRSLLSGMIRTEYAARFIEYAKKGFELSPTKILEDYSKMRPIVMKYLDEGSGADLVASSASSAMRILKTQAPDSPQLKTYLNSFCEFFCDLPLEVAQNTALDLAPEAVKKLAEAGEKDPAHPETLEMIKEHLMFSPKAHARLSQLNTIISKRDDGSEKKKKKGKAKS